MLIEQVSMERMERLKAVIGMVKQCLRLNKLVKFTVCFQKLRRKQNHAKFKAASLEINSLDV